MGVRSAGAGARRRGRARRWRSVLRRGLTRRRARGRRVRARRGRAVRAGSTEYDAIVLDAMLPDLDGLEVCRRLRADARVVAGADAHRARRGRRTGSTASTPAPTTTSPSRSSFDELLRGCARSRAAARSSARRCSRSATCGSTPPGHRAWRRREPLDLSAKELALLETFMRHPGQVLSRFRCSSTRGRASTRTAPTSSTSTCASCARRSTGRSAVTSLQTVRGLGYRLCEP